MSPLGFKLDAAATALARSTGILVDKRSRIDTKGRFHLKGEDMTMFRRQIFNRSKGHCESKVGTVYVNGEYLPVMCDARITWDSFELHHDPAGYSRYESEDSCFAICKRCHRAEHVQVHLGSVNG